VATYILPRTSTRFDLSNVYIVRSSKSVIGFGFIMRIGASSGHHVRRDTPNGAAGHVRSNDTP